MADIFEQLRGPRPSLTLHIEQGFVTGLWVAGRRPNLIIRDFDLGVGSADAETDFFGAPFVAVNWHQPQWRLGLALAPSTPVSMPRITPCHNAAPAFAVLREAARPL